MGYCVVGDIQADDAALRSPPSGAIGLPVHSGATAQMAARVHYIMIEVCPGANHGTATPI